MKMLDMFRAGMDTAEIASRLSALYSRDVPEYLVYNELHRMRCREVGEPIIPAPRTVRVRRSAA